MQEDEPSRWQRLQKLSFNRKNLTKRMRWAENVTVRHARKFIVRRMVNVREVRRHIIMWAMAVGLLIAASGLQLMWYQRNYQVSAAASGGTYAEAVLGPIDTLNPLFASTSAEQSASQLLFSRLLSYDTSGRINNDLATSVAVDSAGTTYTVKLRTDARWHDGIQVTTKDVAFTLGLIKNPTVRSLITGWSDITVSVIDDTTISFKLPAIYAAFPHALTFPILPEHILSKIEPNALRENDFSNNPIGSGPFKLRFIQDEDLTTGRRIIHMERNDAYYKGATKLERFQLHVYGTHDAIVKALASGEVNAASDLTSSDVTQINKERYTITSSPIQSGVYALFNTIKSTMKDKTVRQALQVGTDTQAIREQLGVDVPSLDLPFTNGQLVGDVPKVPTYDAALARTLLDNAGWKLEGTTRKKDGVELKLRVVSTKDSDYERVLENLSGQWRELGIVVDTVIIDPSDATQGFVQNILQQRNFDVLLYQLTIGADPDIYAYWHSSQTTVRGFNFSNYANAVSDDALVSARSRLEPSLRNNKYITFARQWVSDAPAIGLYQTTAFYASSKNVTSFNGTHTLVTPLERYADVLYWNVGSKTVFATP